MMPKAIVVIAFAALGLVFGASSAAGAPPAPVTLTPITTPFNSPIGIDHHEPDNKVVLSVNYPSGSPFNFELVAADGTHSQFSSASGLSDEVKIATVRSGACQAGFTPGELYTGTGAAGEIARISANGSTVLSPWVTLPGESGLMRGSLFQDRYCSFGGDLIVVTTSGGVWRVTAAGTPTLVANVGTHLEGLSTVPNDSGKYGPWAGKILAGAEGQGLIYAFDATGAFTTHALGINAEDIDIVPPNENFFGVDFGSSKIQGAPASEFADKVGDVIVSQEFPGILWDVRWNGTSFDVTNIATVAQWEHVTFSSAGIVEVPPTPEGCRMEGVGNFNDVFDGSQKIRKEDKLSSDLTKPQSLYLQFGPKSLSNFVTGAGMTDRFRLTKATKAECANDPAYDPGQGQTQDTFTLEGEGTYQARGSGTVTPGYKVRITIKDGGESGPQPGAGLDNVHVKVFRPDGTTLVNAGKGKLEHGNQDAKDGS